MQLYQILSLLAGVFHFCLTLYVLSRDLSSRLNRVYFLWGSSLTVWNISAFLMSLAASEEKALFWARFLHIGVIFLPISIFHLGLLVSKVNIGNVLRLFYALHLVLAASVFTPFYINGLRYTSVGYYIKAGPAFYLFLLLYTVMGLATITMLYSSQKLASGLNRIRIRSLLLAFLILIFFGSNDILPILGIQHYWGTKIDFYPLGNMAALFFGIIVSYSVLQHQLLDIRISLGQQSTFLVRFFFLVLVNLTLLILTGVLFPNLFNPGSFAASLSIATISLIVTTIFFPRLLGKGSEKIERYLLGDRFDYHEQTRAFMHRLHRFTETEDILRELADLLKDIGVSGFKILLCDENTRSFSTILRHPVQEEVLRLDLSSDSPIIVLFEQFETGCLPLNLNYAVPGESTLQEEARQSLARANADFCFPLITSDNLFGLLLIEKKTSEQPYTPKDIQIFELLTKEFSMVLNQIRLRQQVLLAQEMDILGVMSKGLAHDLNNLLTPVSTLLQVSEASPSGDAELDSLVTMATQNVKAMRTYIRDSLFFAKNMKPQMAVGQIDELVVAAIGLTTSQRMERGSVIEFDTGKKVQAVLDVMLFQRLVSNLISNAIDASKPDSLVRVELQMIRRRDDGSDWVQLKVIDQGEGISAENLEKMKAAFFTTKDSGDGKRGFGLGLAICRKIVHLHGGTLNISSQLGRGTTVQVELPNGVMPAVVVSKEIGEPVTV